jgi:hypothetical protein
MKSPRFSRFVAGAFAIAALASSFAGAQMSVEKVAATNKILQQVKARIAKMSPSHQKMLDGYANINHLANVWERYGMRLSAPSTLSRLSPVGRKEPPSHRDPRLLIGVGEAQFTNNLYFNFCGSRVNLVDVGRGLSARTERCRIARQTVGS